MCHIFRLDWIGLDWIGLDWMGWDGMDGQTWMCLKLNAETVLHPTLPIDVMNLMTTPYDQSNTQNSKFQLITCSQDNGMVQNSSARHSMAQLAMWY